MLASRPPLGWNSWNTFGEKISDPLIREMADLMVARGYLAAGYEYLVIDDCWSLRDRDENGLLVPDPEKFPHGMKDLADYVHAKGLKFGMYSCAGVMTCAGYPSSYDHEFTDAKTFASWGVDFLKYDFCNFPESGDCRARYQTMAMALKASGREILFSACNWGCDEVNTWIRSVGAHMYRSTGDINDSFVSFRDIFLSQLDNYVYAGPGCFNDIDMLTVGMRNRGNVASTGCTDLEYRTEFALWCMFGAPLMLGCDVREIDGDMLQLVTNPYLLRINQDEACRPLFVANKDWNSLRYVFARVLTDGEIALAFTNLTDDDAELWFALDALGLPVSAKKGLRLTDAFTGEDAGVVKEDMRVSVKAHGCAVYLAKVVDA